MDLSIEGAVITVRPGEALRLTGGNGRRITSVRGAAWVTQDGDIRDIILEGGADVVLNRSGGTILQALGGPAQVALEDGIKVARPKPHADALVARLWKYLEQRLDAARARHELRALSDHMLRDIGLRRTEIDCLIR